MSHEAAAPERWLYKHAAKQDHTLRYSYLRYRTKAQNALPPKCIPNRVRPLGSVWITIVAPSTASPHNFVAMHTCNCGHIDRSCSLCLEEDPDSPESLTNGSYAGKGMLLIFDIYEHGDPLGDMVTPSR